MDSKAVIPGWRAIVAVNQLNFIGLRGQLPWACPEDLRHFAQLTKGCDLIVGRNTFLTLPPLPKRRLHVLSTHQPESAANQFSTWTSELALLPTNAWIIGGAGVYASLFPHCREIHKSLVNDATVGDTVLPSFPSNFKIIHSEQKTNFTYEIWTQ